MDNIKKSKKLYSVSLYLLINHEKVNAEVKKTNIA